MANYDTEVRFLNGKLIADYKARKRLDTLESAVSPMEQAIAIQKSENNRLKQLLITSLDSTDTTGKYTNVNSGDSLCEHESSLMSIDGNPAVYFGVNTSSYTDSGVGNGFIGHVYYNGSVIDPSEETGVQISTGRTQHGDTDVIIAWGESDLYLTKYEDGAWASAAFTDNTPDTMALDGCNAQMIYQDGVFYHLNCYNTLKKQNTTTTTFQLVTLDPVNMTVEKVADLVLPITFSGIYEASLYKFNDEAYLAIRPSYDSLRSGYMGQCFVSIIDLATGKVGDRWNLYPDDSNRPLIFEYTRSGTTRLYLLTTAFNRVSGYLYDITNLDAFEPVAQISHNVNYADFLRIEDKYYWCATDTKNQSGTKTKVVFGGV